jgi:O-antigen/teichoic acid export membrane protein
MNVISILTVLFVQGDRLIISRVLPIAELGFYSVAYSVASGLSMLQNVVTTALFPALAQQAALKESMAIRRRCGSAVQLLMYVSSGIACVLIFYGRDLLAAWISADTASRAATPLAVLALGFMIGAAVAVPYTLAIAAGQTTVPLIVNLVAGAVYVPAMYWSVHTWEIDGAAWAWVGLNTYNLVILVPLLGRGIPMDPFLLWFWRNVLPFVAAAVLIIGGSHFAARRCVAAGSWLNFGWLIAGAAAYALTALLFLDDTLHARLTGWRRAATAFRKAPTA